MQLIRIVANETAVMIQLFLCTRMLLLRITEIALPGFMAFGQAGDKGPRWTYSGATGPAHWGDLSPEFAACKDGQRQSPVDITDPVHADLPPIHMNSRPAPLRLINAGYYIRQDYAAGNGNTITVGEHTYELQQFHFHHPSEETINGKHYDMVAHLVYQNKEAQHAVVGVLIKEGRANPLITTLWEYLPIKTSEEKRSQVQVNASQLIPKKLSYYKYDGSLTTPPCTEGITFFILDTPTELSKQQIAKYASIYPNNARPVQPLNGRIVQHSR